eukprot:2566883-Rhodomonas_salina.1
MCIRDSKHTYESRSCSSWEKKYHTRALAARGRHRVVDVVYRNSNQGAELSRSSAHCRKRNITPALYPHAGVTLTSHAVSRSSDQETEVSHPRARITRVSRSHHFTHCESMVIPCRRRSVSKF